MRNSFIGYLLGLLLALSLPVVATQREDNGEKSWIRFIKAFFLSLFGVALPLIFFFLNALMMPQWKGESTFGWIDCFCVGKLALTPIVVFATAALYALEILRVKERTQRWIVIGIFLGAVISVICSVFGIVCIVIKQPIALIPMIVPFYIAIWYSVRATQLIKASGCTFKTCINSLLATLPFWAISIWWSRKAYLSLPDSPPSCFVVTAASRGHARIVGPFCEITRNGRSLRANQQLLTFWRFEELWRLRSPKSHTVFRRCYNRLGPVIARRVTLPLLADATCVVIKPFEWLAKVTLKFATR